MMDGGNLTFLELSSEQLEDLHMVLVSFTINRQAEEDHDLQIRAEDLLSMIEDAMYG